MGMNTELSEIIEHQTRGQSYHHPYEDMGRLERETGSCPEVLEVELW
jgi:hypothetical protein